MTQEKSKCCWWCTEDGNSGALFEKTWNRTIIPHQCFQGSKILNGGVQEWDWGCRILLSHTFGSSTQGLVVYLSVLHLGGSFCDCTLDARLVLRIRSRIVESMIFSWVFLARSTIPNRFQSSSSFRSTLLLRFLWIVPCSSPRLEAANSVKRN